MKSKKQLLASDKFTKEFRLLPKKDQIVIAVKLNLLTNNQFDKNDIQITKLDNGNIYVLKQKKIRLFFTMDESKLTLLSIITKPSSNIQHAT